MAETAKDVNGNDAQDLHSLLSSAARDFLVRGDGEQVKVESLKGKKIGLYFSAAWCGPCKRFTPQLVEVYNELTSEVGFEIVFVSGDKDEQSFSDYFAKMPWLAVPFTDSETRGRLKQLFKVRGIPNLIIVDGHGKLVSENGVGVIRSYGADAYPFTPEKMKEIKEEEDSSRRERLKEIEAKCVEMAKEWPKKVKHALHEEHELELTRVQIYWCDKCDEEGQVWSYQCKACDFDLHAKCALREEANTTSEDAGKGGGDESKDGWVCDGNVCTKA